nr:hypothetical protein [Tanacetum cinerariifolium]
MAKPMEQYMSKTRADYGSGIARPKIDDNDHFELKGQFLKELRDNTFSGSDHEDANEHIEKVLEIFDLFHIPNITQDRVMFRAFPMSLTRVKIEEINNFQQEPDETLYQAWERLKELLIKCPQHYLTKMQEPSKKWLNTFKNGTTEHLGQEVLKLLLDWLQFKNNSTILERKSRRQIKSHLNGYYYEEKKGSYGPKFLEANSYEASHIDNFIPRKEKDPRSFTLPCYINNVRFDNALADLGASVSVMPLSAYLCLGLGELAHTKLTVELADMTVKYPKRVAKNVLVGIGKFVFPVDFKILDMHEDVKVPLILGSPFLSTAHDKIDVFKRKITLRVGDEKIIFKSVKPASSLIKRVYMLILREIIELDLEGRLLGETLVLNGSLDPLYGYYIELNDLNEPLELRRDQVDDLMPTIKEVEENMDGYRDQDTGDIIFREPFWKASCVEARRFYGLITIHNGNDYVTYWTSLEKKLTKLVKYRSSGILTHQIYMENLSSKTSGELLVLILLISHF